MVPRAWLDSSGMLSFMVRAGAARSRISPPEANAASAGRRWIMVAHRSAAGRRAACVPGWPAAPPDGRPPSHRGSLSREALASRVPVKPSRAGSRVSEPSRTMATVADAATATPLSSVWRKTSNPSIPMITVVPATTTVRPAVLIAVTAALSASSPSCSASRNRVTMNSA